MKKLRTITRELTINAPKDKVWDVLFNQFGQVNNFNPLIEASDPLGEIQGEVGAERVCQITSSSKIHERISDVRGFDSFDIEILEGGLPLMDELKATWEVAELNADQTKATIHFHYNTKPSFMAPLMKGPMGKSLLGMVVGLKYYIETGGLVTKKNIKKVVKSYNRLGSGAAFSKRIDLAVAA